MFAAAGAITACVGDSPDAPSTDDGGNGNDGTTGTDATAPSDAGGNETSTPDAGPTVVEVSSGDNSACAVLSDGTLWCWGGDDLGQLAVAPAALPTIGACSGPCSPTPVQINFPAGVKIAHVAAEYHSCAVDTTGDLYCWGGNAAGELGHVSGTTGDAPCPNGTECNVTPQKVPGIADVVKVTIGTAATCAITTGHIAYCWGANFTLALGSSSDAGLSTPTPTAISALSGKTITDIDMAKNAPHACAISQGEGVYCWGYNDYAQLGHTTGAGVPPDITLPGGARANAVPELVGATPNAIHIATAQWVSCGSTDVDGGNTAGCWGSNFHGAFGNGTITTTLGQGTALSQAAGGQSNIATIVAGGGGSSGVVCALSTDSHLTCWGESGYGEIGNGMFYSPDAGSFDAGLFCNDIYCIDSPQPVSVLTKQASVGFLQSVVLGTDGKVYAWGFNNFGQLGHTPVTDGDNATCTSGYGSDAVGPCNALPTVVVGLP